MISLDTQVPYGFLFLHLYSMTPSSCFQGGCQSYSHHIHKSGWKERKMAKRYMSDDLSYLKNFLGRLIYYCLLARSVSSKKRKFSFYCFKLEILLLQVKSRVLLIKKERVDIGLVTSEFCHIQMNTLRFCLNKRFQSLKLKNHWYNQTLRIKQS